MLKLSVKFNDGIISLLTSKERPPILRVLATSPTEIEIHYETGEREQAHLRNLDFPESYMISTLFRELLGGEPPKIQPFSWSA